MDKPACYNRPPFAASRLVQDGWNLVGGRNTIEIPDNMSKGCQQWGELGEARLKGWDCAGCKWKEEKTK